METIPHQDPVDTFLEDRNHLVYQAIFLYRLGNEIVNRDDFSNPYRVAIQFLLPYFNTPASFFQPEQYSSQDQKEIKAALLPLLLEFEHRLNDESEDIPNPSEFIGWLNHRIGLLKSGLQETDDRFLAKYIKSQVASLLSEGRGGIAYPVPMDSEIKRIAKRLGYAANKKNMNTFNNSDIKKELVSEAAKRF